MYTCEQEKPPHLRKHVRTIASEIGIAGQYKTIVNRYNGGRGRAEAHEDVQKLTRANRQSWYTLLRSLLNRDFPRSRICQESQSGPQSQNQYRVHPKR